MESLDQSQKTFTVATRYETPTLVRVVRSTEFEIERSQGKDTRAGFSDPRAGDWVKVEAVPAAGRGFLAEEAEIYR